MKLPAVRYGRQFSVGRALFERRSVRDYADSPMTLKELSQLLWACQGINDPKGFRTAPSAGALYPLSVYCVVGNVTDLSPGLYKYQPEGHQISTTSTGDKRGQLSGAALGQPMIQTGAVSFVITADYKKTTFKYGTRGIRYVYIEVGQVGENLCLQAVALGLGSVTMGAFNDDEVKRILNLPENEEPVYIITVGPKP